MHNLVSLLSSVYYLPQRVVYSARKVTAFFWNMQIYLYFCQNNPKRIPFSCKKRDSLCRLFSACHLSLNALVLLFRHHDYLEDVARSGESLEHLLYALCGDSPHSGRIVGQVVDTTQIVSRQDGAVPVAILL